MLDIQFIRENAELVKQKSKQKGYEVDIEGLLQVDEEYRQLQQENDILRQKRNENVHSIVSTSSRPSPSPEAVEEGKNIKVKLSEMDKLLTEKRTIREAKLKNVPNIFPDDTPIGGEEANQEEKKWGEFNTNTDAKDHLTWLEERGLIDFERGAKVAGNKFYFSLGALVELEHAVMGLVLKIAKDQGFIPMSVPHLVNKKIIEGTGFMAKGDEEQIYSIKDEDLHLIATSEIPITGYHADEILDLTKPKLYAGISPAYRREAGAYGKHSRGLYRVHQFNKLELYVFCKPTESDKWHQKLLNIEESICQQLRIPYRLVRIASGDLGSPTYKKFDIEYWSPPEKAYRELMSCSNVTDYQARRLNIRYRGEQGKATFVHTLNGTAAAFSRVCIALVENNQQSDGSLTIPEALRPYIEGREKI